MPRTVAASNQPPDYWEPQAGGPSARQVHRIVGTAAARRGRFRADASLYSPGPSASLTFQHIQGFDQLIVLPPLPPAKEIDAALIQSLLASLHASPHNPAAATQRTPRPRTQHYIRPDGFLDDGTWRPPPFQSHYGGPIPPPQQGVFGGGYGYRPPPTAPAWSAHLPDHSHGDGPQQTSHQLGPPPGPSYYQRPPP